LLAGHVGFSAALLPGWSLALAAAWLNWRSKRG
jgi:hypothetical protein